MAEVLSWSSDGNLHEVIQRTSQALEDGGLALLPAECSYHVAALPSSASAAERVLSLQRDASKSYVTLALLDADQLRAWMPDYGGVGIKLAQRCWPGELTLLPNEQQQQVLRKVFPQELRPALEGVSLALRSPGHAAPLYVLHVLQSPLLMIDTGQGDFERARQACDVMVALACDAGPITGEASPTVVQVNGTDWRVERVGALSEEAIRERLGRLILFVCTGNTCRSPLAEALCKRALATKLDCSVDDLAKRGYLIRSAGISAFPGAPASVESVAIGPQYGVDVSGHVSQPLDAYLAKQADDIVCMTQSHQSAINHAFPELHERVSLLNPDGLDLPDPIGRDASAYLECAERIQRDVVSRLGHWLDDDE